MSVVHEPALVVDLRHLLCDWDPLGFYAANGRSPDEYEGLIQPLLTRLSHGADVDVVHKYLDHELHDHFGSYPDETLVGEWSEKIVAWYAEKQG